MVSMKFTDAELKLLLDGLSCLLDRAASNAGELQIPELRRRIQTTYERHGQQKEGVVGSRMLELLQGQGFDNSYYNRHSRNWVPRCSRCEALVINGVATHEHGCPNWARVRREEDAAHGDDD